MWLLFKKKMIYKYSLDKSSKKFICPNCNRKSFVLYVDNETGENLTENFGKCDREQKCNFHKAPPKGKKAYLIEFIKLEKISNKAYKLTDTFGMVSIVPNSQIFDVTKSNCFISEYYLKSSNIIYLNNEIKYFNTDNEIILNKAIQLKEPPKEPPPSFHELKILNNYFNTENVQDNLTSFLNTLFSFDEVFEVCKNYFICGTHTFWQSSTMFWQIDHKEKIHGAKIMLYNANNGKRIKEPYNHINWLHTKIDKGFKLNQCLFGLHRINEDPLKTIAIVESEKTALIMSLFIPDFIWLATGSMNNFKKELLQPIKSRIIVAYPDKGVYKDWSKKAKELNNENFKISVSELLENTNFNNGFDLADFYLINKTDTKIV
jgi:hypothetical protein